MTTTSGPRQAPADPRGDGLPAAARAFLALSPDAALVVAADGTVAGANELACELFGYAAAELLGSSVDRLVPAGKRHGHASRRARFVEEGRARPMSHAVGLRARRSDGTKVPVDIALRPLHDPDAPPGPPGLVLAAVRDMTERERQRQEVERARAAYASLLASLPDAVLRYDSTLRCTYANPAALEATGLQREELVGTVPPAAGVSGRAPGWCAALETALLTGRETTIEFEVPGPGGHEGPRWYCARIVPERDDEGRVAHVLSIARDVTARRRVEEHLREQAATDPLTGLPNHGTFHDALAAAVAAARASGRRLSLVILDVDRFRSVNEQHGHPVGDAALRGIAARLRASVREGEALGRIGGEEFAWLLPGAGAAEARHAAERVRRAVESAPLLPCGRVTVSAGVCDLAAAGGSADRLLQLADDALYEAKRLGRNRVCVHRAGLARS